MAVTNTKSAGLTLLQAGSGARLSRNQYGNEPLHIFDTVTQGAAAGDINSTLELALLPAGSRLILMQSRLKWTAFGAARVVSLGYRAYRKADGTTQAESLTALGTALDVSAASTGGGIFMNTLTGPQDSYVFEGDAILVAQCTGGTIPAGAVVTISALALRG